MNAAGNSPAPQGQAHQATAVAINGRAVLIEGPPGAGKSTLALALIDRGAVLVGDVVGPIAPLLKFSALVKISVCRV